MDLQPRTFEAELRRVVVLAHAARHLLLTLRCEDGRQVRVSHDRAFRPVLTPCLLRRAVLERLEGCRGSVPWLGEVVGLELGGPFVEPLGDGVLVHHAMSPEHVFATTVDPERVRGWLLASRPMCDVVAGTIEVHCCVDTDLRAVSVRCSTTVGAHLPAVREIAVRVSRACRQEERALVRP